MLGGSSVVADSGNLHLFHFMRFCSDLPLHIKAITEHGKLEWKLVAEVEAHGGSGS